MSHPKKSALRPGSVATRLALALALASGVLTLVGEARAQEPDVRNVRPAVMLLVDTSGSMEYPLNGRSGTVVGRPTDCSVGERNRWISLVEVLTGSIPSYSCVSHVRSAWPVTVDANAPDRYYHLPYTQPFSAGNPYVTGGPFVQNPGILDTYLERVKFGLMVYDNLYGIYTGTSNEHVVMMPQADYLARPLDSVGIRGDFSYGPDRPLTFPGCGTTYMVNAGVRNETVPTSVGGALIPFGVDSAADPNQFRVNNGTIQDRLLQTRPYGMTPTAAMLQDYEFYLANHPHAAPPTTSVAGERDRLAACRPQYGILITDGQPSDPFRERFGCGAAGYTCPYDRSLDIVTRLCGVGGDGLCTNSRFRGLFAVLFQPGTAADADVAQATAIMNTLAAAGGTCRTPGACAYLATDPASLSGAIAAALDRASPGARTRTTPSFSSVSLTGGGIGQYEITSGFLVGDGSRPWSGVLNRQRWECDGPTPVARSLETRDRFALRLDTQPSRDIRTVVTADVAGMTGVITNSGVASATPAPSLPTPGGTTTTSTTPFAEGNGALTPGYFGLPAGDTVQRAASIRWVRADPGSGREGARLGDIYHSQPVIVTAPRGDISDESYNLFRRDPIVAGRPPMVYFGTNDGIIHAMVLAEHRSGLGTNLTEGQELWGFVPPAVMGRINNARQTREFLVDGPPVVREVFFSRRPGDAPSASVYRTVLLMGLRQGGRHYVALDVTNPEAPVFLWQWTHPHMGASYGRPAITQALVDVGNGPEQRAVAILPGGAGTPMPGACALDSNNRAPRNDFQTADARPQNRCWSPPLGRGLWVVDVATGRTIRGWDATTIQTPMTGAVSLFTGQTGSVSTRAYLTSADGVLWRLDMTSSDRNQWTFRPFHDLYWNDGSLAGNPSQEPPVVSIDEQQRPVILIGTGDGENLETPGNNYVVSLTEVPASVPFTARAEINWEIRLRPNEMVTGPVELFDGRAYFGTFISGATAADVCEYGSSRIWGVDYIRRGATPTGYAAPGSSRSPLFGWEASARAGTREFTQHYMDLARNQIVMGVGVTQRPSCAVGATVADPYIGPRFDVDQVGGGQFELVAQVSSDSTTSAGTLPEVQTVRRTLPAPVSYTRTIGTASVSY
jgi:type IV pilus assembly protein PilY1